MSVSGRFDAFISNISQTDAQKTAGAGRRASVIRALNSHYWGSSSETANSKYVGSWGKFTRIRPPRDVDVLFELPKSTYDKFQSRSGNKQSQLLQEVKGILATSFPNTDIRGDGPVVKVPFTSYNVEVAPAFKLTTGQYWVCMTNDGGHYKSADYDAEIKAVKDSNDITKGNTRNLIRMMKCWQGHCGVPLKSFWIELIAIEFLAGWENRDKSSVYYDWMVRDFFKYLELKVYGSVFAPGTYEQMYLGDAWLTKAQTARQRAEKACILETDDPISAGEEWQKIFGADIPRYT
ncbi:SMODS domain-containing nucleotidyltransferase [Tabrizicola sp. BL-A-41-H6]|uniref:SMODS domain-containing nucleotidyltransferase n=1 Tax=Tabrizicola sp. BL-A-41-H6 TaxID=3421107 RepID=UPI003D67FF99